MPLYLFYTMVQKSKKWPKTQIKGGSCLNFGKKMLVLNLSKLNQHWNENRGPDEGRVDLRKSIPNFHSLFPSAHLV